MKKRFLVTSILMLLLTVFALSTSTYAWFSMNTVVTANGMQVSAKTDNAYLIISSGTTLSQTDKLTTAGANLNEQLYPTHPAVTLTSANVNTVTSWGSATSNDPDDANVGATVTAFEAGVTLSNYVAKASFKVGIVENSGTPANPLKLNSLTISDVNDGITVVVVCGTNIYTHAANVTGGTEVLALATDVTTTGVQVDVYIYIDGAVSTVKTSNAANLSGTVSMTFSIEN